ncbi:MAG: alpha/beta hydrolase [Acidobacteria bacterium]|nr:alpha/beta hydrolase [Acidobacteriota bacterium]
MVYSLLQTSPLLPGTGPVKIYLRDQGQGPPLFFLHGGWGHEMYPFNRQTRALAADYRCVTPDRSGYGRSLQIVGELPPDFHYRAAIETLSVMDSLHVERASFWGHSDGAVIAAILGFTAPERVSGLILEAFHYYRQKPASKEFFEALADRPDVLGAELCERFARVLGAGHWRHLITTHAKAWIEMAGESSGPTDDLYGGRLHEISAPVLFIHGALDPRTEPGEMDAAHHQLPRAEMHILDKASHSPHSEIAVADQVTKIAAEFLKASTGAEYPQV